MSALTLVICATVAIAIIKLFNVYLARRTFLKRIEHIRGPLALPIIGNAFEFKTTEDPLPVLSKHMKQYGHTLKLFIGPLPIIFTADLALIEKLLSSNTQITKSITYRYLFNWLGNGLLTATNPRWSRHRKILTPTFHFKILDKCVPIFHSNSLNLIEHLRQYTGKVINIHEHVLLCSLDIIYETSMGFSINALKEGNSSDYVKSVKYMAKLVVERTLSVWRQFDMIYQNSPSYKHEMRAVELLHNATSKVINIKRKELLKEKCSESKKEDDDDMYGKAKFSFIDMLLRSSVEEGGTLTDDEIREEIDTFMFAGHDTTSHAISFTLYFLSKHKTIQENVFQEVKNVLGFDGKITIESVNKLKYLEMVIKESLRLYPPVPIIGRELTEDFDFNGQILPKGLTLVMLPYHLHRQLEIYENPDMFIPERFMAENCVKRSNFAYIPFSAGPRNCIGQKFAMLALKVMISTILLQYRIEPSDVPVVLAVEAVLTSTSGINIRLEKR